MNIKKHYSYLLIILSIIGLLASAVLMNDAIKLAENPNVELPCNINPFISCSDVASKWQSHVFGFPNPILGIISFSLLLGIGLILLYRVVSTKNNGAISRTKRNFWILVNYGTLASVLFVVWFAYQSIYVIGSLCPYCMIIWAITWPIFLYTTVWNIKEGHFSLNKIHSKFDEFLQKNHLPLLVVWYLTVALLVFSHFRDYFFV